MRPADDNYLNIGWDWGMGEVQRREQRKREWGQDEPWAGKPRSRKIWLSVTQMCSFSFFKAFINENIRVHKLRLLSQPNTQKKKKRKKKTHTQRLGASIPKAFNQLSEEDIIAFRIKPMESIPVLHLKWQSAQTELMQARPRGNFWKYGQIGGSFIVVLVC